MRPESNGVAPQTASTFDTDFREIRRRAPTDAETARYLSFERLARRSSLDPVSIALIVGGIGGDGPEERIETAAAGQKTLGSILEQLDRIEQRVDGLKAVPADPARLERIEALIRRGATVAGEPVVSEPVRYLFAFAGGVLLCLALAVLAINEHIAPSFVTLTAAFALGLGCALGYSYVAPIVKDMRR
jgi:hypothetical protein